MWSILSFSCAEPGVPTPDATAPPDLGCDALPTGDLPFETWDLATTEDFDFDALGRLFYSDFSNFLAADVDGRIEVVAAGIVDPRGIQVLSDGTVVTAYIVEGTLSRTDPSTGATTPLVSGLVAPNGLEIGAGDRIYVTETGTYYNRAAAGGRVSTFDPVTSERTMIATGFGYPNGIAIDEERDRLFVADYERGIFVLERHGGTWGSPELLYELPGTNAGYDAIEVDACGNLYVVDYVFGRLYRVDPTSAEATLIFEVDQPPYGYVAARWGSDRGGWRRDVLYLSNRSQILGVEVGVRGRAQPVDALP